MNNILKGKNNKNLMQSVAQGGNIMNLISMINISNERRERNTSMANEKVMNNRDLGCTMYESLEYVKDNLKQDSFKLQMEMMKSFIR